MSSDRPASLVTRWLSVIAGVAALVGVVLGLGGGVRAAGPSAVSNALGAAVTVQTDLRSR
ncbi:hypothetical protein [Microbaculum marinum]|uniref:Uncharacterized protein n=1 Tax=Microbaculum marinum TaxID=1764581 RepID=A0AAW9RMV3_9HYPH